MTTVNPHFTFTYSQPAEYHFSHDSVFLARLAYEYSVKHHLNITNVLDLCAGCGIVGMDFLYHLQKNSVSLPIVTDFLEIQPIYIPFFSTNLLTLEKIIQRKLSSEFLNINYADANKNLELFQKYNLIVCNPPFFREGHGALSPSEFKNRCRFFLDSDFKNLISSFGYLLAPGGKALVLIKDLKNHGVNIFRELERSTNGLTFQKINTLRGTELFELAKPLV